MWWASSEWSWRTIWVCPKGRSRSGFRTAAWSTNESVQSYGIPREGNDFCLYAWLVACSNRDERMKRLFLPFYPKLLITSPESYLNLPFERFGRILFNKVDSLPYVISSLTLEGIRGGGVNQTPLDFFGLKFLFLYRLPKALAQLFSVCQDIFRP